MFYLNAWAVQHPPRPTYTTQAVLYTASAGGWLKDAVPLADCCRDFHAPCRADQPEASIEKKQENFLP